MGAERGQVSYHHRRMAVSHKFYRCFFVPVLNIVTYKSRYTSGLVLANPLSFRPIIRHAHALCPLLTFFSSFLGINIALRLCSCTAKLRGLEFGEWRWQRCIPMPLQPAADRREWICASASDETRRSWQCGRSLCCSTAMASRCSTARGIWFLGSTIMLRDIRARLSSWTPPASLFSPSAARFGSSDWCFCGFLSWIDSLILILIAEAEFGR